MERQIDLGPGFQPSVSRVSYRNRENVWSCRETHTVHAGRSGLICRARASRAGDWEFGSRSNQTNDLKIDTCRFLGIYRHYYDRARTGWLSVRIL